MSKPKGQTKSKCLNAKTTPLSHLRFGLCHLSLFEGGAPMLRSLPR